MDVRTALDALDEIVNRVPIRYYEQLVQGVLGRCTVCLAESRIYHDLNLATYQSAEPDGTMPGEATD